MPPVVSALALKYEGLDLAVRKRLFASTGSAPIEKIVKAKPTSAYARRLRLIYEWLTGTQLNLPNADRGTYAHVIDVCDGYSQRSLSITKAVSIGLIRASGLKEQSCVGQSKSSEAR